MTSPLPYHCPTLNGNYLRPPCEGQVAVAKAHRAKFAHALLPYGLEQCLKCKGEVLVKREEPMSVVKLCDSLPEKRKAMVPNEPKTSSDKESLTVQDCRNEGENMTEIMTAQETAPAPMCPKHPEEPQIKCGPESKRAGQYLGACKLCMAGRRVGRKAGKAKEKMTPAVARDLGTQRSGVRGQGSGEVPPLVYEGPIAPDLHPDAGVAPPITVPACKVHPDRPAKIDSLGRDMRFCVECLQARGQKGGKLVQVRGTAGAPVSIPLNQGKYAALKAWLEKSAEENERTLNQEIMFRLKVAMRKGED